MIRGMSSNVAAEQKTIRFSIFHLLTLITVAAIVFALPRTRIYFSFNPTSLIWKVILIGSEIFNFTGIIAGFVFVLHAWFIAGSARHPGHQLTTVWGSMLCIVFSGLFLLNFNDSSESEFGLVSASSRIVLAVGWCVAAAVALNGAFRDRWWWRITFLIIASHFTLSTVTILCFSFDSDYPGMGSSGIVFLGLLYKLSELVSLIAIVWTIVCAVIDLITKTRRDWLHWWAIFFIVSMGVCSEVLPMIAARFLSLSELYNV